MRLALIFEARDPDFEKSIEPYLTAPYKAFRFKPPKDYVKIPDIAGKLQKAVYYHAREFGGERWTALEQAFLSRKNLYIGKRGDMIRPRVSLFKYLNNVTTPWPEGDQLAMNVLDSNLGSDPRDRRYFNRLNPDVLQYLVRNWIYIPDLYADLKKQVEVRDPKLREKEMEEFKERHAKWQKEHEEWAMKRSEELEKMGVHDIDIFGWKLLPGEPPEPHQPGRYDTLEELYGPMAAKLIPQYVALWQQ